MMLQATFGTEITIKQFSRNKNLTSNSQLNLLFFPFYLDSLNYFVCEVDLVMVTFLYLGFVSLHSLLIRSLTYFLH